MPIPIIDLFAGPGGLGEGFSSFKNGKAFKIKLSIEKEATEHKTLELRSFFRQFEKDKVPEKYYELMREPDLKKREDLKKELFRSFPRQYEYAKKEAWQCTLGGDEFPPEIVNTRIKDALKGEKNWVLIGGPPCQAYSLVGRSRRQWKENLDKKDHRVHLYKEYLRIIADHHPSVFVMENVKGLLSSKVDGTHIFDKILRDLRNPGIVFKKRKAPKYRVFSLTTKPSTFDGKGNPFYDNPSDFLIKAENYGVPQKRHRVILLGVRSDIKEFPVILSQKESVNLKDVIGDLPPIRSALSKTFIGSERTPNKTGVSKIKRYYKSLTDSPEEWKKLVKGFAEEIQRINGFSSQKKIPSPVNSDFDAGSEFIPFNSPSIKNPLVDWYRDERLKGVSNHQSRSHLTQDLKRYLFASLYTQKYGRFPKMDEYAKYGRELLPEHQNAESGKFSDRFRVQLPNEPATTVTSHISKDGHYFIHYDPSQCRSLTVREAARIQTFPDNYLFWGPRTHQYHQVGNAVPPFLAYQIAEIVEKIFYESLLK
ncbi:DNA (cytosine-5-)-methyltransferase [Algoriphagus marincola]|uniref:DNA (cytosine-5-)-methyltransferase n=1 Tax=Algoriphagus marincola TaxID=264027 RepID=A0ABS7N1E6_9BACT|nr:DNA (cytosine-5-)-methyltransferase [Algoriphagus marincola]MBY5950124.1 DNA (cytosine-5-)-methyltransferase [Algoriphagus marincola]